MTKRAKFLMAGIALALCAAVIWKLNQDAREPVVTNQPLPAYVPDEVAKEVVELWPAQQKGKWGYINRAGEFVIKPQFESAWEFNEGLAPIQPGRDRQYGFINKTGQMVIAPRFIHQGMPSGFREGLARITGKPLRFLRIDWVPGQFGFTDADGNLVIPVRYDVAGEFHEGLAYVGRRQGLRRRLKWGFINRKGELVIDYEFDNVRDFSEGLAVVKKDDAYFFITPAGMDVLRKRFSDARNFAEGLAAVQIGSKWGYINQAGEMVIAPQFRTARPFSEGLAAIETTPDKWGFIDRAGKIMITPAFENASDFSEGLAAIRAKSKWGVIDKAGTMICEPQYLIVGKYRHGAAPVVEELQDQFFSQAWLNKAGKIIRR